MPLCRGLIYHEITYDTAMTMTIVNQVVESQQTPHISPSMASYEVYILRIWEKIDRVLTASHCNLLTSVILANSTGTVSLGWIGALVGMGSDEML